MPDARWKCSLMAPYRRAVDQLNLVISGRGAAPYISSLMSNLSLLLWTTNEPCLAFFYPHYLTKPLLNHDHNPLEKSNTSQMKENERSNLLYTIWLYRTLNRNDVLI